MSEDFGLLCGSHNCKHLTQYIWRGTEITPPNCQTCKLVSSKTKAERRNWLLSENRCMVPPEKIYKGN